MIRPSSYLLAATSAALFGSALACGAATATPAVVEVDLARPTHVISHQLMGTNTIFSHDDAGKVVQPPYVDALRRAGVRLLRYPGGEVTSYFHADQLGYPGWHDAWQTDPKGKGYLTPEDAAKNTHHLSLEQFIALCRQVGATPLVGINIESGMIFNREDDSLREAADVVRTNLERGYGIRHWFIDNESYHGQSHLKMSVEDYAQRVNQYADVIRKLQPDAQIIVNWQGNVGTEEGWKAYRKLFEIAGHNIDICDAHWYWRHNRASFAAWLETTPMRARETAGAPAPGEESYAAAIREFKRRAREAGFPNIKLAALEWNAGPAPAGQVPTAYECLLIQSEMMLQFMEGGLDLACLWPGNWPNGTPNRRGGLSGVRTLVRPDTLAARPNVEAFHVLTELFGQSALQSRTDAAQLVTFAAASPGARAVWICLINKTEVSQPVRLAFAGGTPATRWDQRNVQKVDDDHVQVVTTASGELAPAPDGTDAPATLDVEVPALTLSVMRLY